MRRDGQTFRCKECYEAKGGSQGGTQLFDGKRARCFDIAILWAASGTMIAVRFGMLIVRMRIERCFRPDEPETESQNKKYDD